MFAPRARAVFFAGPAPNALFPRAASQSPRPRSPLPNPPSPRHLPLERYVEPAEFDFYRRKGLEMGFARVESGALVRSSYHAQDGFLGRD